MVPKNLRTLRLLLVIAIALLVIAQVASWVAGFGGWTAGLLAGLLTLVAFVYCNRQAQNSVETNSRYYFWILLPSVIFGVMPTIWSVARFTQTEGRSFLTRLAEAAPFWISFVIPLGLLLIVYMGLGGLRKDA